MQPSVNVERDFKLELSKGNTPGQYGVDSFGANEAVASGSTEDIWDGGGTYPFPTNTFATGTVTMDGVEATTKATGTITCDTVLEDTTVTVNGLTYTAVTGVKSDNTEFSIDTSDNAAATDLADSITNDTRTGTLNDVTATASTNIVTCVSSVAGTAGNATTLSSSDGTTLAVSGATFTGGADTVTVTVNGLVYTAVTGAVSSDDEFSVDTSNDDCAASLASSINSDTRVGTLGDVSASATTDTVTLTTNVKGTAGNAVTLASSNATTLAVSGTTFSGGGFSTITKISQTSDQAAMRGESVRIRGLDVDGVEVVQTVALNSSNTETAVALTTPLIRIMDAEVLSSTIGESPIRVHNTAETVDYAIISTGENKTRMAIESVPAGYTGYITSMYGSTIEAGSAQPTSVNFKLSMADADNGYGFRTEFEEGISKSSNGFEHKFDIPLVAPSGTDVKLSATTVGEAGNVRGGFTVVLVKNSIINWAE